MEKVNLKFAELKKHLASKKLYPCYLIDGKDRFLIESALKQFCALIELPEFNINYFDETSQEVQIEAAAITQPIMSEYRLIVLQNQTKIHPVLTAYLKKPASDVIFIVQPAINTKITSQSGIETVDCSCLDDEVLRLWIARESGGKISKQAVDTLIEYCSGELSRISVELNKLLNFCGGREITAENVRSLVSADTDYKIYQLLEKLGHKNGDAAYEMINAMGADAAPMRILSSMFQHFRKLFHIKVATFTDAQFADSFNVKPFALKYLREQASKYSPMRLKNILDYISNADYRIKSGKIKDKDAVVCAITMVLES